MNEYRINNILIPNEDIITLPEINEQTRLNDTLVVEYIELALDSTNPKKYDDSHFESIFYGSDFHNKPLTILNTKEGFYWKGFISGLSTSRGKVIVKSENYAKKLLDVLCVYSDDTGIKTIVEVMFDLLIFCGIPESQIDGGSFAEAKSIQKENCGFINIDYVSDDNIYVIDVINELRRISQCDIILFHDIFYFKQWHSWDGKSGVEIKENHLIAGTFERRTDESKIFSKYEVKYIDVEGFSTATGESTKSVKKYGDKFFKVPNVEINEETGYKIIFSNVNGASWSGQLALDRYDTIKKLFSLRFGCEKNNIRGGSRIDLSLDNYYREPGEINYIRRNLFDYSIDGEFINLPYSHISRDVTRPSSIIVNCAAQYDNESIIISWEPSQDSDFSYYKILYGSTKSYVEGCNEDLCNRIVLVRPKYHSNGLCYTVIKGFAPGYYYFTVLAYDKSDNSSLPSRILIGQIQDDSIEQFYNCSGNCSIGVYIDAANNNISPDYLTYGDINYTTQFFTPGAYYESFLLDSDINQLILKISTRNKINIYIREYVSGQFQPWQFVKTISDDTIISLSENRSQVRIEFDSFKWSDKDYFYIQEVKRERVC